MMRTALWYYHGYLQRTCPSRHSAMPQDPARIDPYRIKQAGRSPTDHCILNCLGGQMWLETGGKRSRGGEVIV